MHIGPYRLLSPLIVAPMAGVTDRPFRQLCRRMGAGLAVSEMLTSDLRLKNSNKSRLRSNHDGEPDPISVQIVGSDPKAMAEAARYNQDQGAQILDINMGCPAKKVCKVAAGSALLRDEELVERILTAVVGAVDIPVTLKIRTGWDHEHRNAPTIARIAEDAGITALAVHGRTRACAFRGEAEYDTIRKVREVIDIPLIANGDINTAEKAAMVLQHTGADAVMIGRGAQGRPWIFREIDHYLKTGKHLPELSITEARQIVLDHLQDLHAFYGDYMGVCIARKHLGWYSDTALKSDNFRSTFNRVETTEEQLALVKEFFARRQDIEEKAA